VITITNAIVLLLAAEIVYLQQGILAGLLAGPRPDQDCDAVNAIVSSENIMVFFRRHFVAEKKLSDEMIRMPGSAHR